MAYKIINRIRNIGAIGNAPYRQVHAHSTGNPRSTATGEASYMSTKNINTGYYTHVVGNGQIIQTAHVNRGAWDVGGSYNYETYAAVELIESHSTKEEFLRDYKIYVELLRDLAKEAGIPVDLDSNNLAGIKTHDWCRTHQPYNATDHIDPYHYLAKWGISRVKFAQDIKNGFSGGKVYQNKTPKNSTTSKTSTTWKKETGTYTLNQATNLRTGASTKHDIIAKLPAGSSVKYDAYAAVNGYLWLRQPRSNGYAYIATGTVKGGKRNGPVWGTFK